MEIENQILEILQDIHEKQAHMEARIDSVLNAFPASDTEGHRRYHESVIEWQELRNKIVREALIKISATGLLAGIGWLAWAAWQTIKMEVHR